MNSAIGARGWRKGAERNYCRQKGHGVGGSGIVGHGEWAAGRYFVCG